MKKFISVITVAAVLFFTFPAFAHPGGTDSSGCHAGSQPYHCHNSGSSSGSYSGGTSESDTESSLTGIIVITSLTLLVTGITIWAIYSTSNSSASLQTNGTNLNFVYTW